MNDLRYIENEDEYLKVAHTALRNTFSSYDDLFKYYCSIPSKDKKNEFLRVASFYRYLVRDGNWHTNDTDPPVIDYLTNSFKVVALFSLIESVGAGDFVDFTPGS